MNALNMIPVATAAEHFIQLDHIKRLAHMKRLQLYLNGILAITTRPLDESRRLAQIANWQRVYGHGVKIETVDE